MKTTLKGHGKYYPGCFYGLVLSLPFVVEYLVIAYPHFKSVGTVVQVILFVVPILLMYFLFLFVGKRFHDFTERMYDRFSFSSAHSKHWDDFTEIVSMFLLLLLFMVIVQVSEHIRRRA